MPVLSKATARKVYDAEFDKHERATEELKSRLNMLLKDLSAQYAVREGVQISGEPKGFDSFYKKIKERKVTKANDCLLVVKDLARARVVVQTLPDVYKLKDLLERQKTLVPYWDSLQDYIDAPQERGYRSLHLDVGVEIPVDGEPQTVLCELQIRTIIQDAWGAFSHKDFYKGAEIPPVIEEQMVELSNLLAVVDRMASSLIGSLPAVAKKPRTRSPAASDSSRATGGASSKPSAARKDRG
jgi:putative GTP pyrophosphokinase